MADTDPSYDEFKPVGTSAMRHRPTDALIRVNKDKSVTAETSKLERETADGRKYSPEKVIAMALAILRR
jgi:hypothetical protein